MVSRVKMVFTGSIPVPGANFKTEIMNKKQALAEQLLALFPNFSGSTELEGDFYYSKIHVKGDINHSQLTEVMTMGVVTMKRSGDGITVIIKTRKD